MYFYCHDERAPIVWIFQHEYFDVLPLLLPVLRNIVSRIIFSNNILFLQPSLYYSSPSIHNINQPTISYQLKFRCGPCLLMAPEFEAAAKELDGKVRFVKLDTDLEPQMAGRLQIMGLPTLLFLDKNDDAEAVEEGKAPVAVLKERIEGALRKQSIVDLCNYHFFGGAMPEKLM